MAALAVTFNIMFPMLILLALGWLLRKIGWLGTDTAGAVNKLIFRLFLPVLLFSNMRSMTGTGEKEIFYLLFIFAGIGILFLTAFLLVPRYVKDPRKQGVMVQGIFRTNFAILGIPLMESMFGEAGIMVYSLALPVVIPMNNILAVVALSVPGGKKPDIKKLILDVLRNPLIIGCALGFLFRLLNIQLPSVCEDALKKVNDITSPLSLIVLGASLTWRGVQDNRRELVWTVLLKQLLIPAVMITAAILLGFSGSRLGVLIILFGAPCAVSSFPMADAMGGDSNLAASQVVLTTIFSMGTLFALIYIGKLLALI